MTMTAKRLAELDAVMAKMSEPRPTKIEHKYTISDWCGRIEYAKYALADAYPDLRAHIDAQAATIARLERALHKVDKLLDVGNALSFAAQTTGGIAGRDESLVAAIDAWTAAARKGAAS